MSASLRPLLRKVLLKRPLLRKVVLKFYDLPIDAENLLLLFARLFIESIATLELKTLLICLREKAKGLVCSYVILVSLSYMSINIF